MARQQVERARATRAIERGVRRIWNQPPTSAGPPRLAAWCGRPEAAAFMRAQCRDAGGPRPASTAARPYTGFVTGSVVNLDLVCTHLVASMADGRFGGDRDHASFQGGETNRLPWAWSDGYGIDGFETHAVDGDRPVRAHVEGPE